MKYGKKIKVLTLIFVIGLLAAAVVFGMMRMAGEKKTNIIKILPNEADILIQDFVFTEVGQDNIRWEVKSKSAQYQKQQNLALFDQVQIKLTTKEGKVLIMTGDKAEMLTDKKDVEIRGHVVITSDTGEKFSTDYLRYTDARKKIYTDAPVFMESERMKIEGGGLTIFIDQRELTLFSGVKATIKN